MFEAETRLTERLECAEARGEGLILAPADVALILQMLRDAAGDDEP